MTYVANVPVSGQTLGGSRPIINTNFTLIQSFLKTNHQDFNLTNAGFHTFVDLLSQGSNANPPTGTVAHYSKVLAGVTEWFFQRETTAGPTLGQVIQMSSGLASNTGAFPTNSGQTFLPGGIQLKWGYGSANPGPTTVTFASLSLGDFPNNGLIAFTTGTTTNSYFTVSGLSQTGISVTGAALQGGNFFFLAIGN